MEKLQTAKLATNEDLNPAEHRAFALSYFLGNIIVIGNGEIAR